MEQVFLDIARGDAAEPERGACEIPAPHLGPDVPPSRLYRRSWPRLAELAYWPTLNMLIWGFTTSLYRAMPRPAPPMLAAGALIGGVLLWEMTLRSQMGVAIGFLEEIWSRNLGHIFVSPLRPAEMMAALIGVRAWHAGRACFLPSSSPCCSTPYNLFSLGPVLVLFFANLMIMGWAFALGIVALLFRYGAGAEALAWTLALRPHPARLRLLPGHDPAALAAAGSLAMPAAHVFEGMRAALLTRAMSLPARSRPPSASTYLELARHRRSSRASSAPPGAVAP